MGKADKPSNVIRVDHPTFEGMKPQQMPGADPNAVQDIGLQHTPMDVLEFVQRSHGKGKAGYAILLGFKGHIEKILSKPAPQEFQRHVWDKLFGQYCNSDNSPEHPLPTFEDVQKYSKEPTPTS